jgi:hypothetical protein
VFPKEELDHNGYENTIDEEDEQNTSLDTDFGEEQDEESQEEQIDERQDQKGTGAEKRVSKMEDKAEAHLE